MQALRTRAAGAVSRSRTTALRSTRSYASESHGHDHHAAPPVEESFGAAFYIFAGFVPLSFLGYQISRPGPDGEPSAGTKFIQKFDYFNEWETRNALRTQMFEQAAHDKHLFYNVEKNMHIELKTPELMYSTSPRNVPAGHIINLDHVTEHYRKQAAAEEERVMKKLAEKKDS
ncbi:hypothetical protein F5Y16DRAFT_8591 [Xylariaceae sp. FL0255]|nr:hypothetical protein F5Y16DRAFT_8591 [Xylariaceae sp. FL0255]